MKLTLVASSVALGVAFDGQKQQIFLQAGSINGTNEENSAAKRATYQRKHYHDEKRYGLAQCPCIGIDKLEGETWVQLKWPLIGEPYPADLGARCEAWDDDRHPKCKDPKDPGYAEGPGKGNGWCSEKWCYVDACNCDLDTPPKGANYLPKGRYQGKDLFYSYHTCGAVDKMADMTKEEKNAAYKKNQEKCDDPIDREKWGVKSCSCVGIDGQPGNTVVKFDKGKTRVKYPADVGATCKPWDDGLHPDCDGGGDVPAWCKKKWCYVDPCECDKDIWEASSYLGDANYRGRPLYFSYASCGEKKMDQKGITTASDIDKMCASASSLKTFLAFALLLFVSLN